MLEPFATLTNPARTPADEKSGTFRQGSAAQRVVESSEPDQDPGLLSGICFGKSTLVRLLGHYLNRETEAKRLLDLCRSAAGERVGRTYSAPNRAVPRLTMSQNAEIVKLYRGGMKTVDIALAIGTSEWTIHHRLNRLGVERRPRAMSPAQTREAVRLYEAGESLRQLSLRLGFNDKTIKKALVQEGVEVRDRRRSSR